MRGRHVRTACCLLLLLEVVIPHRCKDCNLTLATAVQLVDCDAKQAHTLLKTMSACTHALPGSCHVVTVWSRSSRAQALERATSCKKDCAPCTWPTGCAGAPATMTRGATALSTSDPAAICAPLPTVMLPSMVAAAPISTLSSILGCRSPASLPVPVQPRHSCQPCS